MKSFLGKLGVIFIGLTIFGYVGCSSSRKSWTKADYDPYIYQKDESFCQQQGRLGADKSVSANEIYKQCMYSLGYFVSEEKTKWVGVKIGEVWKYYFSQGPYLAYYDAQSIIRPPEDIFTVWVRWNLSKRFVSEFVREHGNKFEKLSYIKQSVEVNCLEKKDRWLSWIDYDNKGKMINSFSSPSEWDFVTPESVGESLYEAVCK